MSNIRFLERLSLVGRRKTREATAYGDDDDWLKGLDPDGQDAELRSIMRNISNIMNTRQGSSVLSSDYGVPDFTGMGVSFSRDDMPEMEQSIANSIEICEPRLRDVQVTHVPDANAPLRMVFSLQATICQGAAKDTAIQLKTTVSATGMVTVSQ